MPLPGMDRPPLPGPEVQSQMGVPQEPPPGAGLSQLKPMGAPAPGAPNPHGFLLAQVDAVKKLLDQMASAEPVFAPFAQKATQVLDNGLSAVNTAPGPGSPGPGVVGESPANPPPPGANLQMPALG